jgi:hypothetical protein
MIDTKGIAGVQAKNPKPYDVGRAHPTLPHMSSGSGPSQMREFLDYWGLSDRAVLARAPSDVAEQMDSATRQVIFVGLEDLISELASPEPVDQSVGRLAVYMDPAPGDEARWQLATMLADTVVLRRPRFENRPIFGHTVRELCEPEAENVALPPLAANGIGTSSPSEGLDPEIEAMISEFLELDEHEPVVPREDQLAARLPAALAHALRFAAHLAAVGDGAEVVLVDPDLSSARDVVRSLDGVYFHNGAWHTHDSWIGGSRPDTDLFGQIVGRIDPEWSDTLSVLGAYAAGAKNEHGHLPLAPKSEKERRLATEFFCRFGRLHFGNALVETGPRAETFITPGDVAPDWRPALSTQMLLAAFPHVRTADLSTFEYLHGLPGLADLRHRLRIDAERVENCTARELETRISQIAVELSEAGGRAKDEFANFLNANRKNLVLTWLANAVTIGAGFVSFGPIGAMGAAAIAASATAALEQRKLDPRARFTASELGLLALANTADTTGRRQPHARDRHLN